MEIFVLPDVGEGLTEADIITWRVAEGDTVAVNQVLVEIETAKSLVELPSPFAGTIATLYHAEGDTVEVGENLIAIDTGTSSRPGDSGVDGADPARGAEDGSADADDDVEAPLVGSGPIEEGSSRRRRRRHGAQAAAGNGTGAEAPEPVEAEPVKKVDLFAKVLAKPPVRKLAKDRGVDLTAITPTGVHGEVTRHDVENYLAERAAGTADIGQAQRAGSSGQAQGQTHTADQHERIEKVPVRGVRKATAAAVTKSYTEVPHITLFAQVDATRTMKFVSKLKASREYADVRVTPLLLMARALLRAIRRTPYANSEWTDENILVKPFVNLGIAAATPRGLLVPNIKDAETLSLHELAGELNTLTDRARDAKTQPEEMAGTTVSITNIGSLGLDTGTPILNPGSAAIFAFGAIKKLPWEHKGKIKLRDVVQLAGSFDHRILDGADAGQVMKDIAEAIEEPALLADY